MYPRGIAPSTVQWCRSHDQLDFSSETHDFTPGLSRYGRAEVRICRGRRLTCGQARACGGGRDGWLVAGGALARDRGAGGGRRTRPGTGWLVAGGALAQDVEAVAVRLEALGVGELADRLGHLVLEGGREGDVGDLAAVDAQQMMVVLGQILGELEAGELIVGGDPPDQPGGLEVDQVPVGGAAGQVGQAFGDVADAHRVPRADQQLDDRAASRGVPLIYPAQAALGRVMQFAGYPLSWHCRPPADVAPPRRRRSHTTPTIVPPRFALRLSLRLCFNPWIPSLRARCEPGFPVRSGAWRWRPP